MPTASEQHKAAQADLLAKRNAAVAAQQILRGLMERAESGEPVTDAEIADAAKNASRSVQEAVQAEEVVRACAAQP
jgi:dihydroxyacetone kinase-like predicted kinase